MLTSHNHKMMMRIRLPRSYKIVLFIFLGLLFVWHSLNNSGVIAQQCITADEIRSADVSQTSCLYVFYDHDTKQYEVWDPEFGKEYKIHHDNPCGIEVTCTINPSHFSNLATLTRNTLKFFKFGDVGFFKGYLCQGEEAEISWPAPNIIWSTLDPAYCALAQRPIRTPTPSPTGSCGSVGDIDCSGQVNKQDLDILINGFGTISPIQADLDQSDKINILDMSMLLTNFTITP